MFSWICPQCGREVPPSYTECPDCAAKGKVPPSPAAEPAQPPADAPPVPQPGPPPPYVTQPPQQAPYPAQYGPPQPQYAPQPPQYPQYAATAQYPQPQYQQPPQYPPPQYAPPRPRAGGLPTWLLTVIFAVAFVGLGFGVYWLVGSSHGGSQAAAPAAESPAAKAGTTTSAVQKFVEISGIRFAEDAKKRIMVKFTVTNHSDADLSGLAGNVTVAARTQNAEKAAVGTFSFSADVPPEASKEVSAPLTTKLKMYELPDWQNVTTDVRITAPQ